MQCGTGRHSPAVGASWRWLWPTSSSSSSSYYYVRFSAFPDIPDPGPPPPPFSRWLITHTQQCTIPLGRKPASHDDLCVGIRLTHAGLTLYRASLCRIFWKVMSDNFIISHFQYFLNKADSVIHWDVTQYTPNTHIWHCFGCELPWAVFRVWGSFHSDSLVVRVNMIITNNTTHFCHYCRHVYLTVGAKKSWCQRLCQQPVLSFQSRVPEPVSVMFISEVLPSQEGCAGV